MPPKPLAEDLARKKAEREKQRKAQAALAVLEKPSGLNQAVNALKDPVGTAKQLGRIAKETFYDPSKRFAAAVDPNSGASLPQRAAGLAETALYAADMLTPGVPEGAVMRNLEREAMEKALDREVASYAASGRNTINHRTVLGVHGSPTEGLTRIMPKTDDTTIALDPQAWFWNANESNFNARKIADQVQPYAGPDGEVYFARFPKKDTEYGWTVPDAKGNAAAVAAYSTKPGRVVESTPGFFTKDRDLAERMSYYKADTFTDPNYLRDFVRAFQNSMTPAERRAFIEKQPEIVKMFAELKAGARPRPPISPRQRYTEQELDALRVRPTLQQIERATKIPLEPM